VGISWIFGAPFERGIAIVDGEADLGTADHKLAARTLVAVRGLEGIVADRRYNRGLGDRLAR
jgi:hypothetical protein